MIHFWGVKVSGHEVAGRRNISSRGKFSAHGFLEQSDDAKLTTCHMSDNKDEGNREKEKDEDDKGDDQEDELGQGRQG